MLLPEPRKFLRKYLLLQLEPSLAHSLEATVTHRLGEILLFLNFFAEDEIMRLDLLKGHFDPFLGSTVFYLQYKFHALLSFPFRIHTSSTLPSLMEFKESSQQIVQAKGSAWTSTNWMHTKLEIG